MTPNDRLSDKELASVAEYVDTQQASGKYGATFAKVTRALAELRAHRAAALSAVDRETLRDAAALVTIALMHCQQKGEKKGAESSARILAVLTRLTGGAP